MTCPDPNFLTCWLFPLHLSLPPWGVMWRPSKRLISISIHDGWAFPNEEGQKGNKDLVYLTRGTMAWWTTQRGHGHCWPLDRWLTEWAQESKDHSEAAFLPLNVKLLPPCLVSDHVRRNKHSTWVSRVPSLWMSAAHRGSASVAPPSLLSFH